MFIFQLDQACTKEIALAYADAGRPDKETAVAEILSTFACALLFSVAGASVVVLSLAIARSRRIRALG